MEQQNLKIEPKVPVVDLLLQLQKEKDALLWQLSFARDRDIIEKRTARLAEVENLIRDLTIQNETI